MLTINKTRTKEGLEKQLKQIEEMVEELLKESEKIDKLEEGQTVKLTEELSTTQSRKKKIEEAIKKIKETENRNINITDNESVMIKGRQGTHSGYNAQMVVDEKNGLIVSSNVVSKSNDLGQFSSEIKNANEVLGKKCKTACADAGYFDLKDLNELAKEEIEIIVPNTKQAAHNPKEITIYDKENFNIGWLSIDGIMLKSVSNIDELVENSWFISNDGLYVKTDLDITKLKVLCIYGGRFFNNHDSLYRRGIFSLRISNTQNLSALENNEVESSLLSELLNNYAQVGQKERIINLKTGETFSRRQLDKVFTKLTVTTWLNLASRQQIPEFQADIIAKQKKLEILASYNKNFANSLERYI